MRRCRSPRPFPFRASVNENMSYLLCPHCSQPIEIFGHGGGRKASERLEVPFLGEIPLDPELRHGGDVGRPILVERPDSPVAATFRPVAASLARGAGGGGV